MARSQTRSSGTDPIEQCFSEFYSSRLMPHASARLRPREIRDEYLAWALATGGVYLSYRALVRLMAVRGHYRVINDGAQYLNVAFKSASGASLADIPLSSATVAGAIRARGALHDAQLAGFARDISALIQKLSAIQRSIEDARRG